MRIKDFIGLAMVAVCCIFAEQTRGDEIIRVGIKSMLSIPDKPAMYPLSMAELQHYHAVVVTWMLAYEEEEKHLFPIAYAAMSRYIAYRTSCGVDWRRETLPSWFHLMAWYVEDAIGGYSDKELQQYGVTNPHAFRQMVFAGVRDKERRYKEKAPTIPDEQLLHFMEELVADYDAIRYNPDVSTYVEVKDMILLWRTHAMFMYLNELCGYQYPLGLRKSIYSCFLYMDDKDMSELAHRIFEVEMSTTATKLDDVIKNMTYEVFIHKWKSDMNALFPQ